VGSHDDDFIIVRGNHHSLLYWTSITYTTTWFNGLGFVTPVLRIFIKTRPLSLQLMHPIYTYSVNSRSIMLILEANKSLSKNLELIIRVPNIVTFNVHRCLESLTKQCNHNVCVCVCVCVFLFDFFLKSCFSNLKHGQH
jgi:hypothetical protein